MRHYGVALREMGESYSALQAALASCARYADSESWRGSAL
jgi:hypothetical protein